MKYLFCFLVLFVADAVFAQNGTCVLRFEAVDQSSKLPVSQLKIDVLLNNGKIQQYAFTNKQGIAHLTVPDTTTISFHFDHVAYEVLNEPEAKVYRSRDTITMRLKLKWIRELNEVVIRPPGFPDTVFQSERLSVQDFEFLPDGKMVLLTYPKNFNRGTELLIYDGSRVTSEIPMKEKPLELIRDYRGNPHVVTEKTVCGIANINNQVELSPIDRAYFMSYIAPIVDTSVTHYFFSNYSEVYPAFEYFTYNFVDSVYKKIANIEDEFMMELYRSEYKWVDIRTKIWAKEKEHETGIDAEIWVGATYFTQSIYYKELYAPMFQRNDSVFVFDHYKNWMYRYNGSGELMDSVPIYYHLKAKENGWKKQLIQDQVTGQVYIVYELAGKTMLQRFDCATGKLGEMIPLYFRYAENVTVRDNFVYYIYRPFESIQKKFLYEEKLPIMYPAAKS